MRLPGFPALRWPGNWRAWVRLGAGAALAGAALFWLVAPYNIAASLPHLPGVKPLLHGYMKNAVRTWSIGIQPPPYIDLADPGLVRLGAGHFETGCAPCHGAPGRARNPVAREMLPEPPKLDSATQYKPRELYWLVRNGLKYTAMPAWSGAHRPDEPWALVAFLLAYPELDEAAYQALILRESEALGPAVGFGAGFTDQAPNPETVCARCHGKDGRGRDGTAPKLAGQSEAYLVATLDAYAHGRRESGMMEPLAAALPEERRLEMARHFAAMEPFGAGRRAPPDPGAYARGAELARRGDEGAEIPSCLACHGEGPGPERRAIYPRISGQDPRWLAIWLNRWRERPLGGTAYAKVMHEAARRLKDNEIADLVAFFAAGGGAPSE